MSLYQGVWSTLGPLVLLILLVAVSASAVSPLNQASQSFHESWYENDYSHVPPYVTFSKVPFTTVPSSSQRHHRSSLEDEAMAIHAAHDIQESQRHLFKLEEDFVSVCYGNLTSSNATSDGNITTIDVYNFIKLVDDNATSNYLSINVLVQLEWMWTLCPRSWRNSAQCYAELEEMNDQGYDYGFLLVGNDEATITSIYVQVEGFCRRIWYIYRTTDSPSRAPSPTPSISLIPSIQPTSPPAEFSTQFKYVLGFEQSNMNALKMVVDKEGIMATVENSTSIILTEAGIGTTSTSTTTTTVTRTLRGGHGDEQQRQERNLLSFVSDNANNSIENINTQDVKCPNVFSQSKSCVLAETKVLISANPTLYDQRMIDQTVLTPMEASMTSSKFLDTMNRSEVKEVLFVGSGEYVEPIDITKGPAQDATTNVPFVAAALGGSFLMVMGLAIGRSRVKDKRGDSSAYGEEFDEKLFQSIVSNNDSGKSRDIIVPSQSRNHVGIKESSTRRIKPVPDATPILEKLLSTQSIKLPSTRHLDTIEHDDLSEEEQSLDSRNDSDLSEEAYEPVNEEEEEEEWMTKISYVPDANVPLSFSGIFGSRSQEQKSGSISSPSSSSDGSTQKDSNDEEESEYLAHPGIGGSPRPSLDGLMGGSNTKLNPLEVIEERRDSEEALNKLISDESQNAESSPSQDIDETKYEPNDENIEQPIIFDEEAKGVDLLKVSSHSISIEDMKVNDKEKSLSEVLGDAANKTDTWNQVAGCSVSSGADSLAEILD